MARQRLKMVHAILMWLREEVLGFEQVLGRQVSQSERPETRVNVSRLVG